MLKALSSSEYRDYYENHIRNLVHTPFQTPEWALLHHRHFGDDVFFALPEDRDRFHSGMLMFRAGTPYGDFIYSFGRFGVAGLVTKGDRSLAELGEELVGFLEAVGEAFEGHIVCATLGCLSLMEVSDDGKRIIMNLAAKDGYTPFFRVNHVVDLETIKNYSGVLSFRGGNPALPGKPRRNIARNLRKANESQLRVNTKLNPRIVAQWHAVHRQRIRQLHGQIWDEPFFHDALRCGNQGPLVFFGLYQQTRLVGGAMCFASPNVLDIFMMSTLREYQELGGNHLIAEQVYLWAGEKGIRYVNWQGSNPPSGGVVEFKEQWMARPTTLISMSRVLDAEALALVDWPLLLAAYPNRFFYPLDSA